ncbi:MAG: UdgX family uracil-DNA binding protein [Oceanicaulis sp.]
MIEITLGSETDFDGWRDAARRLCAAGATPGDVSWRTPSSPPSLLGGDPEPAARAGVLVRAPKRFIDLAKKAAHLRDSERFARLYALLVKLQDRSHLLDDPADPDAAWLWAGDKSIRRDIHKMHAFVRFKAAGTSEAGRERFAAWFEPEHRILELAAPFFMRRFAGMDWVIVTPDGTAAWDGSQLAFGQAGTRADVPAEDAVEDQWRTYFKSIFNPARLKVHAMTAEMPKKYWKNLPEAALIPDLIAEAETRSRAMQAAAPTAPSRLSQRLIERRAADTRADAMVPATLEEARAQAARCERCPLHCNASQTVFGEGPQEARLMIVGEQPGDAEDLAGRLFVGPAGQVLDGALRSAGIDRRAAYLTNAVKHFKYERRGRRRIHQRPTSSEIDQCRWWLDIERDLVKPEMTIVLGASAARGLLGETVKIADVRGRVIEARGGPALITVHPSYLLRLPDPARRAEEEARFVEELASARGGLDERAAQGAPNTARAVR